MVSSKIVLLPMPEQFIGHFQGETELGWLPHLNPV